MLKRRLQNRIAESRWALPLTALYGIAIVVALGAVSQKMWAQTTLLALSTLLMVELNNANALIRIYSRMVSCSFLVLMLMAAFLFPSVEGGIVSLSFITFYVFFLQAYQDKTAVGPIYTAFLAIGIASLFFVQIFFFVPLFWLLMAVRLQAFSLRTFCASLLGLITPYWFLIGYFIYQADYETPLRHFTELARFAQPATIDIPQNIHLLATFAFIVVLTFTGIIHFLRQRSKDKLRTQMIYELFLAVTLFTIVFLVLQPQHNDFLLRILIIHAAIFIGHFVSLTHTKITNIAFIVILVLTLALTALNLVHSSPFMVKN
ncbi:MAG: hypothetical protein IKW78_03770 [Prevotella sp.]|nr:hypothetical protein [Prevotella sp.]